MNLIENEPNVEYLINAVKLILMKLDYNYETPQKSSISISEKVSLMIRNPGQVLNYDALIVEPLSPS